MSLYGAFGATSTADGTIFVTLSCDAHCVVIIIIIIVIIK